MSKLRKTVPARDLPAPDYADSLYMIRDAVRRRERLIYGQLSDGHGAHCAIGSFFADNPKLALKAAVVDEVARYNDSIPPRTSDRTRKRKVLEWLNWKLKVLVAK